MRPDAGLLLLHQTPIPSSTLWLGKLLPPPPAVIRILCYFCLEAVIVLVEMVKAG